MRLEVADLTGDLPTPGRWDRIIATVSVPGTARLLAAPRGGAAGHHHRRHRACDRGRPRCTRPARGSVVGRASFMATRAAGEADYPPRPETRHAWEDDGDEVGPGRYPVIDIKETWDLRTMLALAEPGITHDYDENADGLRTAVMVHPDGSWARAVGRYGETPTVHQSGPRRLWDSADAIRHDAVSTGGTMPIDSADVTIDPTGEITLKRGKWEAHVPAPTTTAA